MSTLFFYLTFLAVTVNYLFNVQNFSQKKCTIELQDLEDSSEMEEKTEFEEVKTIELISYPKPLFLFNSAAFNSFNYKESKSINRSKNPFTPPQRLS